MLNPITTNKAPAAIGPYSQAIVQGGLLFTSGQIPLMPTTGEMVTGDIQEQAEQVMQNLGAIFAEAGTEFSKVIKTTCYLVNMSDFASFNAVYERYFVGKPARSCVAVAALPKGAKVEVECIAEL